ncbi:MAG: hypothetical protein AB8F95_03860 [Bacteroidia bacterium]
MKARVSNLIDKHLRGEFTPREAHEWEKIRKKPEVLKELSFRRDLLVAIQPEGKASLKAELIALERGLINPDEVPPQTEPASVVSLWRRPVVWAVAASVLVLAAVGYVVNRNEKSEPSQALYAEAWKPYPNELSVRVRGAEATSNSPLAKAMEAYDAGQFTEALRLLSGIQQPADTIAFYRANALLASEELAAARAEFNRIFREQNHPYQAAAGWYLALLELKTGNMQLAKSQLEAIAANSRHPFSARATRLLAKLPA